MAPHKRDKKRTEKLQTYLFPHEKQRVMEVVSRLGESESEAVRSILLRGMESPEVMPMRPRRLVYRLAGSASAGDWKEEVEAAPDTVELLDWHDGDYILNVDGDCLEPDGVFSGDLAQVQQLEPQEGDIVVATGTDTAGRYFATMKHFHQHGKEVELQPSSPDFPTICASASEVTIRGVVVATVHRHRRRAAKRAYVRRPVPPDTEAVTAMLPKELADKLSRLGGDPAAMITALANVYLMFPEEVAELQDRAIQRLTKPNSKKIRKTA